MNVRNLFENWYRNEFNHTDVNRDLFISQERFDYVNENTRNLHNAFDAGVRIYKQIIKLGTVFTDDSGIKYIVVHIGVDYFGLYSNNSAFSEEYLEVKLVAKNGWRVELQECSTSITFTATIS